MNKSTRITALALSVVVLFASCSSSTMIVSNPPNAKLFVDGEMVGQTPYRYSDTKIVGSTTGLRIEKEGFKPLITDITRNEEADVGAIIGGLFVWIPFLWVMKYKPTHTYELQPLSYTNEVQLNTQQLQNNAKSRTDMLRELKQLLDEKIITVEEFEKEKAKILDQKE
jgi:hypothetical protein